MSRDLPPEAEEFLRRLRLALSGLSREERDDVLAEIRSHFEERARAGQAPALKQFGAPDEYAAQFIAESTLRSALARGTPFALGHALLVAARGSLFALPVNLAGYNDALHPGLTAWILFPFSLIGSSRTSQPSPVIWPLAWCLPGSFSNTLGAPLRMTVWSPTARSRRLR